MIIIMHAKFVFSYEMARIYVYGMIHIINNINFFLFIKKKKLPTLNININALEGIGLLHQPFSWIWLPLALISNTTSSSSSSGLSQPCSSFSSLGNQPVPTFLQAHQPFLLLVISTSSPKTSSKAAIKFPPNMALSFISVLVLFGVFSSHRPHWPPKSSKPMILPSLVNQNPFSRIGYYLETQGLLLPNMEIIGGS